MDNLEFEGDEAGEWRSLTVEEQEKIGVSCLMRERELRAAAKAQEMQEMHAPKLHEPAPAIAPGPHPSWLPTEKHVEVGMTFKQWLHQYGRKILAKDWKEKKIPPKWSYTYTMLSFAASFIGIFIITALDQWAEYNIMGTNDHQAVFAVAPFGAHAVLIYTAIASPLAQPRNAFFGNMIGGFCGVSSLKAVGGTHHHLSTVFAAALAVSTTIVFQEIFNVIHPPGGAIALAAILSAKRVKVLGYWYLIFPVAISSGIMITVALLLNNLPKNRRYPLWW